MIRRQSYWESEQALGSVVKHQLGAALEDSSNSILLDNAGLTTIKRGSMPAFEGSFAGQETHRFTVDLDFKASS